MSPTISLVGTVGTTPRLIHASGNVPLLTFRMAATPRKFDRTSGEWADGETSWYTVHAFRGLAEHAHESFVRGDRVFVSGRLRIRAWKSEERAGTAAEIDAESLGHDLRWGSTRFTPAHAALADPSDDGARTDELQPDAARGVAVASGLAANTVTPSGPEQGSTPTLTEDAPAAADAGTEQAPDWRAA